MGQELKKYYEKARQMGGVKGIMRLAMLTLMTSADAEKKPDTANNIAKFNNAMLQLEKEFKKR